MKNTLQRPSTTLNIVGAVTTITNSAQRVLIIGELGSTATADTDEVIKDINPSDLEVFGKDSMLYLAINRFKDINSTNTLDVLPISNGTAKATLDITVNNTATKDSKLIIEIGTDKIEVIIKKNDTNEDIATKIEDEYKNNILFTPTRSTNVVTLETKSSSGEWNNLKPVVTDIYNSRADIKTTAFKDGVSNSLADNYLDDKLDERYQTIIFPYSVGTKFVYSYLDKNFNKLNEINDGVAFTTMQDTLANIKTIGNDLNSKSLVLFANITDKMIYNVLPLVSSAEISAIRALRLTDKTNISNYVLEGSLETKGGMSLCTLPYFNTPLTWDKPKGLIKEEELVDLINKGVSIWTNNGKTVLSEVVTTYKKDASGNPDNSWKYLNYVDTMSTIREYLVNNLRRKYGQTRLTDGNLIANKNITNVGAIKATVIKLYNNLAKLAITRMGLDKYVLENLTIKSNLTDGTVTINAKIPIVTQLRAIDGNIIEVLDFSTTL
jgi:phage tail sheath gpL-like